MSVIVSLNEYRTVCNDFLRNSCDPNEIKPLNVYNNLFSIDNIFNIVYLYNIYNIVYFNTFVHSYNMGLIRTESKEEQ